MVGLKRATLIPAAARPSHSDIVQRIGFITTTQQLHVRFPGVSHGWHFTDLRSSLHSGISGSSYLEPHLNRLPPAV